MTNKTQQIMLAGGHTITVRQERDPDKVAVLSAPFTRLRDNPPTTPDAQATAFDALAIALAPYVEEMDAPALGAHFRQAPYDAATIFKAVGSATVEEMRGTLQHKRRR